MFLFQKIEVMIGLRFNCMVDIVVKSNVSNINQSYMKETIELAVVQKLLELNELSQKFGGIFYQGTPVSIPMKDGDVYATTSVIFENNDKMNSFLNEVNKGNQT